ncbi:MAG TPA: DUF5686 and carboxypeptidase regulatory-like domain-containing protein [Chitinophagaceae bacterium]|nr:DUF5686 and carboxypeptidase regulatory-like domain-containing protein [Chitinophagaceae bacterium]
MRRIAPLILLLLGFINHAQSARISGAVTNTQGMPLAYASIQVKSSGKGTSANAEGKYFIDVPAGTYTLLVQYVGYAAQEKKVTVTNAPVTLNFQLQEQQLTLSGVTVKMGGEDPAYEIIRNAIKKRKSYLNAVDSFTTEAYIKTLIKTRHLPRRIFGQKIDSADWKEMRVDSAGKGIIYLSESFTRIAYKKPGKVKLEVLSGRESGSNGFGFNFPTFINFYENNVNVLTAQIAPRGFVSPIAEDALNYYKYHYLGSFFEDGIEVNKIQVTPRRPFEPLFSGTINITEGDWRIHSLDLVLTKKSQLEILDTVEIKQIHAPVTNDIWRTKNQVVYFSFKLFGIDAVGNFLNVYNKYDINPQFGKKYFSNILVKYDTSVNKKTKAYWDSIRPVPLEPEEIKDYKIKDSAYQYQRDSVWTKSYIDSLRRRQGKINMATVLQTGFSRTSYNIRHKTSTTFRWYPLLPALEYNTVEGLSLNAAFSLRTNLYGTNKQLLFIPHLRYGFSNRHFNTWASLVINRRFQNFGNEDPVKRNGSFSISGGKRITQFNKNNPITPGVNALYTLFFNRNYIKLYENYFAAANYNNSTENGLHYKLDVLYEDRIPLENSTNYSVIKYSTKKFTPNYPTEILDTQFARHQAFIAGFTLQYKPGQKFIQYPRTKVPIGSKYPTFELSYQKGFHGIAGSDVDFDKWKFSVFDDMNLKLLGNLRYRIDIGGFINNKMVPVQDYQFFNGNQTIFASQYMNSFQLAPYYANSTTSHFYAVGHIEHHFNGLLTNKIPLFRRLNWYLVAGSNAFYVNGNNNYVEIFGGVENILKVFRVDFIGSYLNGKYGQFGVRIGFGGLIGGKVRIGD